MKRRRGIVYLVGAGPGDPRLITVYGRRLLRRADVVVHDRLLDPALLARVRRHARLVDVGKSPGRHTCPQDDINRLLIENAQQGRRVVRLKGGDPFVFGRGGEELQACRNAGVPCVVVPGVTSAVAAPAAVGIPVTHRGVARSFAVVAAQTGSGAPLGDDDWRPLVGVDTLVVMMGRSGLREWTAALVRAGRDPDTPAACVASATTAGRRSVAATLGTLADAVDAAGLAAPVVTIVGDVASFHANDESARGLEGRRVLLTQSPPHADTLARFLEARGAIALRCPLIQIRIRDGALREPLRRPADYDWIAFTSVHAVEAFRRALAAADLDVRAVAACRVAAVGKATARALRRIGLLADFVPRRYDGASLAAGLIAARPAPTSILYPRSSLAPGDFQERLREAGARVTDPVAYETMPAVPRGAARRAAAAGFDAVAFSSPSAVRQFVTVGLPLSTARIACMGRTTAEAARASGLPVHAVAASQTAFGLARAIEEMFIPEGARR